jgi:aryl-alcohol dehydrogenase-like predicted oxidoreductase
MPPFPTFHHPQIFNLLVIAPSYRGSEAVLGQLMDDLGNRGKFFLSTKVTAPDGDVQEGIRQMENSFEVMKEWKQEGKRIRDAGRRGVARLGR